MNGTLFDIIELPPMIFRRTFTPLSYELQMYLMPLFLAVGIIGNPISFAVWISRKIRQNNSSAVYMAMLAVNDFFLNMLSIIYYLRTTWGYDIINFPGICKFYNFLYVFFQYNSLPLVFGFTLERWIAVCYPFQRERCCTENRAWMACCIIIVTNFVLVFPQNFMWYHIPDCHFIAKLRNSTLVLVYQTTMEFVISALIPILTLGLNILVIIELYRISLPNLHYSKSFPTNNNSINSRNQTSAPNSQTNVSLKSTTTTLLLVSFFHILTTLPLGAAFVAQYFFEEGHLTVSTTEEFKRDPIWKRHFQMHAAKDIIDFLSLSHYCFNIVIYLASSQQFRCSLIRFVAMYLTKQTSTNNSFKNSYLKLRHSLETKQTEIGARRQLVELKGKSTIDVIPGV